MAAGSEASAARVAARGFNLLLDQFAAPAQIGAADRRLPRRGGGAGRPLATRMRVAVARNIRLADSAAAIDGGARARQAEQHRGMLALSRGARSGPRRPALAHPGLCRDAGGDAGARAHRPAGA